MQKVYLQTIAALFFSFLNLNFVSNSFKLGQMSHTWTLVACGEKNQNVTMHQMCLGGWE